MKKAPSKCKRLKKKPSSLLLAKIRFSKNCAETFKKKKSVKILTFGDFTVPKKCSSRKNHS